MNQNKELFYSDRVELERINLLNGVFKTSQEKGKEYILDFDIDRLIAPFYEAAGKEPKKKRYGGWESMGISGHSLGHWLSAVSYMYGATKDKELLKNLDYAVKELEIIQSYDNKNYVSGFPRRCFDIAFTGEFEVSNFELAGHWVPWYSIHKVFAGLLDTYRITKNETALNILLKLTDWAYEGTKNMTDGQFQKMIICEIGGMNDTLAELYMLTNDERHLKLAKRFCQNLILDPLADSIDELEGKHGNSQIPKILGAARLYNITGDEYYRKAAEFFFNQVVKYRTYVIGGNSKGEHFGPINSEELGITTTETCNTYNMLKLTEILYNWEQKAEYMDFYERALFNHILPSQDPDTGGKTYFVSTEPGHFKIYCSKEESFWCCTGTGMENPARYNKNIYSTKDNTLYVNQFIASEYIDNASAVRIIQQANIPLSNKVSFKISNGKKINKLKIRIPSWSDGFEFKLNGEFVTPKIQDAYAVFEDMLYETDVLEVKFDIELKLYNAKDDSEKISFMYGPVVLAGALGREGMPEDDNCVSQMDYSDYDPVDVAPIVASENEVLAKVHQLPDSSLAFKLSAFEKKIKLLPFYEIAHERYSLYWYRYDKAEDIKVKEKKAKYEIKISDTVSMYEQQSEIDHGYKYEKSSGDYSKNHKKAYRYAEKDGYFSYELKIKNAKRYQLEIEELMLTKDPIDFVIMLDEIVLFRASMRVEKKNGIKTYKMELAPEWLAEKEKTVITIKGNDSNATGKLSLIALKIID